MKKVLYVILGLIVLYIVLALFGPKQIKVERQVSINKPAAAVKEKLGDFRFFHDNWSPWTEKDPAMKTTYQGNPGEIGHHYSWSGNKDVGSGEMELVAYSGDTIMQKLSFEGQGDSKAYFILKDNNASTDVTWGMMFDVGFMGRPIMLFMNMDKMLGEDYEKGLSKLKTELENMPDAAANVKYQINEQQWEEKTFVSTAHSKMTADKCGNFFGENWTRMMSDLEKNKVKYNMAPSAVFYSWDEKTMETDCAAIMNVSDAKSFKGWEKLTIPPSKVLHVAYYGDQSKNYTAHTALENHIKEKGLTKNMVIEEYVTDPTMEKDTTKWLTNIYYVLK